MHFSSHEIEFAKVWAAGLLGGGQQLHSKPDVCGVDGGFVKEVTEFFYFTFSEAKILSARPLTFRATQPRHDLDCSGFPFVCYGKVYLNSIIGLVADQRNLFFTA